jgi:hypothetical protein
MGPAPDGPVLSPLGIFLFHLYFVLMHNLHLLDNAQKYISITAQLKQTDKKCHADDAEEDEEEDFPNQSPYPPPQE